MDLFDARNEWYALSHTHTHTHEKHKLKITTTAMNSGMCNGRKQSKYLVEKNEDFFNTQWK